MKSTYQPALHFVKSKAISTNYPTFTMGSEEDEMASIMGFVEKMYPDTAIIVCQRSPHPSVQYVSLTCKKVFGLEAGAIMKMTLSDFLDLIHPEDVNYVNQCYSFINSTEPYNPSNYRFEIFYRLKHQNGYYINVCEVKMAIENSKGKFIYLNSFKDVSSEEKFHDVRLNIYQYIQGGYRKINTYQPRREAAALTQRQNEIANLIGKGFTNVEIAGQLHVSISTVKNHKNRLFKKAKVKTSIELASLVHQF
jgi:DNA-binding CsgD family transcriptional regulator